jgi:transcriptional regulator with XRE-family HTH domain
VATRKADALGDYLTARRKQVRPEDVGLDPGSRRRVAGLRREEVALLAGISVAYYLRIEQGHVTHPSEQVVYALARALQLDIEGTEHLCQLAHLPGKHGTEPAAQKVADGLGRLIAQFPMPAAIVNRCLDVLASNPCARALSPEYTIGENVLRWRLLEPAARQLYSNWEYASENLVRGLREVAVTDLNDRRLRALIDQLTQDSPLFRQLWERADVGYRVGTINMRHPRVGELELYRNRLSLPHSGGQHILIYHAEPESVTARALEALRSLPTQDADSPTRPDLAR